MSISNLVVQGVYAGNGATTTFSIPYAFLDDTGEDVTKVYTVDTTTGVRTLKTLTTDYSLPASSGEQPSTVEFVSAPASGTDVLVTRVLTIEQAIEWLSSSPQVLLENIQEAVDILTMLVQQVDEIAQKSIRLHELVDVDDFDPRFPIDISGAASCCPITNATGDGWDLASAWPTADEIENAQAYAIAALASEVAAALSESNALASATASATSASNSAASAAAAAASAIAAAASAAAAAASALSISGFSNTGPFNVTDGQAATNLLGEALDGLLYSSAYVIFEIIRGTTVMAQGDFSLHYKNSVWEIVLGASRGDVSGVTFSITQAVNTVQIKAALDVGAGNGTIKLKKATYAA